MGEVAQDLSKHFHAFCFFFKFHVDPFEEAKPDFFDYFVILTEHARELFHLTGVLTGTLEHRQPVLNFHCGTGALKHAMLMYVANSHAGRNANYHYIIHFRFHQSLIVQLLAGGIFTAWSRH